MGQKFPAGSWRERRRLFQAAVMAGPNLIITAQGQTRREALQAARASTKFYSEMAQREDLPLPGDKRFAVSMIKV